MPIRDVSCAYCFRADRRRARNVRKRTPFLRIVQNRTFAQLGHRGQSGLHSSYRLLTSGRGRLGDASALAPKGIETWRKPSYQNLILSRLSKSDFQLLEPHLEPTDLPVRKVLERRGKPIKAVYFPETGFASVVANGDTRPIEVGVIGREGMTGLPVVLGGDRNEHETFMQAAGHGHCIRVQRLREAMAKEQHASGFVPALRSGLSHADSPDSRRQRTLQDRGATGAMAAHGRRPHRER